MEIRELLFREVKDNIFSFSIMANEEGLLAGVDRLIQDANQLQLQIHWAMPEGSSLKKGTVILTAMSRPMEIVKAEEILLGRIGKPSGIATAARRFLNKADGRIKVVCGAWKKVPLENKNDFRQAMSIGGIGLGISNAPFVYLDKNYVRMMGGIVTAVTQATTIEGKVVVVQLRQEYGPIFSEAEQAISAGARILMVDTGEIKDLQAVVEIAKVRGWRERVKIAFAGGILEDGLADIIEAGADIVDVGRAIIDAPLLDFRLDVTV